MFARNSLPIARTGLAGRCAVVLGVVVSATAGLRAQNIESPVEVIEGLEPVTLEYGDHTVGAAIDVIGDSDRYWFSGEVGDTVDLRLAVDGSQEMWIQVRDPDQVVVTTNFCTSSDGCDFNTRISLAKRGQFSVLLEEAHDNEIGPYVLQLERLPPFNARPDLHRLYYGAARFQDRISPDCDADFFAFEGVAGTTVQIAFRVLDLWEPYIEIRSDDGTLLLVGGCTTGGCDFSADFTVPATGTYFLIVGERQFNESGAYDVSLRCSAGACPPITEAVYQIVDAGPNCVSVRLINNVPVSGGELAIGYPSSVVSIAPGDVVAGPGMPAAISGADIDVLTDFPLGSCPQDPEDPAIDRAIVINWLDRDGGNVVLLPGRHEILTLCFDPADGTDNSTCPELEFLDCLGPVEAPIENIVTHSAGGTVVAETVDARLCLTVDTPFRRGDANGDGRFDVSDPIAILICSFLGRGCTSCRIASDANDDDTVDASDAIYLLNWRFHQSPAPPAPFPGCGGDPTPSESAGVCIEAACI